MAKIMMKGSPCKAVEATMGAAAVRFSPSAVAMAMVMPAASSSSSSSSLGKLRGLFAKQRKETASLCACRRGRELTKCRLCKVDSIADWSPLRGSVAMAARMNISFTNGGNNSSRQPSLVRGMRTATTEVPESLVKQAVKEDERSSSESESEEGESAELPEEPCEDLDAAAWSVGLDGLNASDVRSDACVLGIDPDASGAIAVLKAASQEVLDVPCVKVQIGKTMRRRHDASSIVELVNKINAPEGSVAYVEQAMPFPKDGKQGWYGCGFGYGMWVGILMALGFKVVPVRAQAWKSAMGISGRQYTKDDSRTLAMALFPDLGPQLKRKKDHGRADAILIAAFGKGLSPQPKLLAEDPELNRSELN